MTEDDASYRMGIANGQRARRIKDALGTYTSPVYVQSDAWAPVVQSVLDSYELGFQAGYAGTC